MSGLLEFEFRSPSGSSSPRQRDDNQPMRILLCGDFSGRSMRTRDDTRSLAARPIVKIDIDNFDDVISRFAPTISLSTTGASQTVEIGSLDDFHPDNLFTQLDIFKQLRELRERLQDPSQFEQASSEILRGDDDSNDDVFQDLLGGAQPDSQSSSAPEPKAVGLQALLHNIVAPHIVKSFGREQEQLVRAVDASIAHQMRQVLHDSRFQAVESLWRSVHFLVTRLELDERLQLLVFDVTRAELEATAVDSDIEHTDMWKALVERQQHATDSSDLAMVIALEAFSASEVDVMTLASLASIAAGAGAPVIATAAPELYGCEKLQSGLDHHDWHAPDPEAHPHWYALRASALAPWIGLVAPRLLLRLPYGKTTDPVDLFEFEEMTGSNPSDTLLWTHPGAACAFLAATAYMESGSQQIWDRQREIDDLPAWIYEESDERQLFPCTETWLSDRDAEWLMSQGLMVLASRRDRPAAQLLRWQSIAEPAQALAGH